MENSWIEHEALLLRVYSTTSLFPTEALKKEFRSFVSRFKTKTLNVNKRERHTPSSDVPCNSNGVPSGSYNKYFSVDLALDEKLVDKFQLREVPKCALNQFEYILTQYFKFRNARRFKKLKELRKCQASLPIANVRNNIVDTLSEAQILIIAGDTGCGKSTQLPQYLLETAAYGRVACTQPRRLACTALARRVACETLKQFGSEIAFQTRFDKTKTSATRLLFLTEGLLLRQLASDADLMMYDVIILDEVHERNTSGDLLVSLLRNVSYRRPGLKLVLMSATINIDLFSSFFPGAPIIKVPGRLYPIELQYMPPKVRDVETGKRAVKIDCTPYVNILQLIDTKYSLKERGDVLIFLNGISEISAVADALKEYADFTKKWIVLILHSTLSVEEQNKVFDLSPTGVRKCILSTNIAETSVTIDEIRFVVDSGKENLMRFDASTRTHRLTKTWISKASAEQRKGRAGRTGPGVCFRLYSEQEFEKMEDFTLPEIKRISLDSLIMQILDMNLEVDVRDFQFLERPDHRALNEAIESLKSQGVVDGKNERALTPLGTILAKLPVDVPVGKMLVCACVLDQLDVALTIAAGLSVQSPFTNRSYRDFECVQSRQHLISDLGDPFTLIKIYREWIKLRMEGEDTRKWTRKCGIEEARLYEIVKLRRQLRSILEQSELVPKAAEAREFEAMSSRERRIKVGEKRKLFELKKRAGYEERKSKILKEGRHFDTIMDEKNDPDTERGKGGEATGDDINNLEFCLLTDNRSLQRELASHRLNDATATILKMIIASGCYPQYATVDPANNFRVGHDLFAHTSTKPFTVVHPNSALGQMPEALQVDEDSKNRSTNHQLIFFGLLLETTKSYLCNASRMPALFLLLTARNIVQSGPVLLTCDGFVEMTFASEDECSDVLEFACEIRAQLLQSVENKLNNDEYGNSRELQKKIVNFSKLQTAFSIRKIIDPPKAMDCGVFLSNGDEHPLTVGNFVQMSEGYVPEAEMENDKQLDDDFDEKKLDDRKLRGREYFCEKCDRKMWFENNVEVIRHKKSHEAC